MAEFVGTLALTFIGTMTAAMAGEGFGGVPAGDVVIPALGHGLILAAMVYAFGHVSGCHINPAVTISLAAIGKFPLKQVGPYLAAQVSGGLVGALFHFWVRARDASDYGLTVPGPGVSEGQAFLLEAILTFLLVTVIIGVAVSGKVPTAVTGIAIGGTLAAAILAGGALTGASLNPARTLGPAAVSHNFTAHWLYWLGPIAGGLAAALVATITQNLRGEPEAG